MSPADDVRIEIARLSERVGAIDATSKAAHGRIDEIQKLIKSDLDKLLEKLDDVTAWMNRGKGWAAAALLLSGMVGGLLVKLLGKIF